MNGATRTVHVLIEGRVQGVGYRAWAAARAAELGISGYVRNRRSGSVEAEFSGPSEAVSAMLDLCRQGPPGANVTGMEVIGEGVSAATGFSVLPTV